MKRPFFRITVSTLCILFLFSFVSCTPKHETVTEQSGNYEYSVGELIKIKDIETNEIIAELTVTSCTLVKSEPFEVTTETETGYTVEEYAFMYEITYNFKDYGGTGIDTEHNFDADSSYRINPYGKEEDGKLYIAKYLSEAHRKADTLTLEYTYDRYQRRHTALITITADDINAY